MNEQVPSKELCDCCESRSDRRCCWDEITSLRGQLEAAEQHVKVLRENFAAHKPGCAISSYLRGADRVTCDCGGTAPEPPVGHGFNGWFLSLEEGRQAVLREDKWMLAENAFEAGKRLSQPPAVGSIHGLKLDRPGWVCSVCHGWNEPQDDFCTHTHPGSHPTKPGEQA